VFVIRISAYGFRRKHVTLLVDLYCTAQSSYLGCTNIKRRWHNHMRSLQHACTQIITTNSILHSRKLRNILSSDDLRTNAAKRENGDRIITKAIITLHYKQHGEVDKRKCPTFFFFFMYGTFSISKTL
jgi:hypothetical protein